jgi:hypothetical protein
MKSIDVFIQISCLHMITTGSIIRESIFDAWCPLFLHCDRFDLVIYSIKWIQFHCKCSNNILLNTLNSIGKKTFGYIEQQAKKKKKKKKRSVRLREECCVSNEHIESSIKYSYVADESNFFSIDNYARRYFHLKSILALLIHLIQ